MIANTAYNLTQIGFWIEAVASLAFDFIAKILDFWRAPVQRPLRFLKK
jgi:hypothetical protein